MSVVIITGSNGLVGSEYSVDHRVSPEKCFLKKVNFEKPQG